jgi:hypothetical protein
MTSLVRRNLRSLGIVALLSLLGTGAALYALRAVAQASDPPAAQPAPPSAPEESATIEDDPTVAADPNQSADNNVSFPVDI